MDKQLRADLIAFVQTIAGMIVPSYWVGSITRDDVLEKKQQAKSLLDRLGQEKTAEPFTPTKEDPQ